MRPLPLLAPRQRGAVRRRKERVKWSGCIHVRGKRLCAWQRNNPGGIWMKVMRVGWVCCAVGMLIGAAAARCGVRAGFDRVLERGRQYIVARSERVDLGLQPVELLR